jgi:hypothetical protein
MFGQTQSRPSSVNAIAYLLLVAAQIDLWSTFLTEKYPNRQSTDAFPGQTDFAAYCGTTPKEYLRGQHSGGPHSHGSAIDIEYTRSPYIPMHYGSGYIWDHDSYKYLDDATSQKLVQSCVQLWDKICGGTSPSCPTLTLSPSEGVLVPWIDQMVDFNTKVIAYFAPGGGASSADRTTFQAAVPMGYTRSSNGNLTPDAARDPAAGILGFTKDTALGVLGAKISDIANITEFSDGTLQSTLSKYTFQWGPFVFGPDLQHFDIERITSRNGTPATINDVQLAQGAVEAALTARPTAAQAGNGPWAPAQ